MYASVSYAIKVVLQELEKDVVNNQKKVSVAQIIKKKIAIQQQELARASLQLEQVSARQKLKKNRVNKQEEAQSQSVVHQKSEPKRVSVQPELVPSRKKPKKRRVHEQEKALVVQPIQSQSEVRRVDWQAGQASSHGFLEERFGVNPMSFVTPATLKIQPYCVMPIALSILEKPLCMKISDIRLKIMMNTWRAQFVGVGGVDSRCPIILDTAIKKQIFNDDIPNRNVVEIEAKYSDDKVGLFWYDTDLDQCYFRMR